jgi:hypothetical protein
MDVFLLGAAIVLVPLFIGGALVAIALAILTR